MTARGLNGLWLEVEPDLLAEHVLKVAEGATPKAELAELIRRHVVIFSA